MLAYSQGIPLKDSPCSLSSLKEGKSESSQEHHSQSLHEPQVASEEVSEARDIVSETPTVFDVKGERYTF